MQLNSHKYLETHCTTPFSVQIGGGIFETQKVPDENVYLLLGQDEVVSNINTSPVDCCCNPAEFYEE